MRVLVFKLWGPYAHFRRVYTTTSSYSYSFPPRTALLGLVGAILGIGGKPRAAHLRKLSSLNVSVVLRKPPVKTRITINHPSTKESKKRLQIPLEVIRDPEYLVFVGEFKDFERLAEMIKNKESIYTPFLGISEFIAVFEYVGVFNAEPIEAPTKVDSVVPSSFRISFESGVLYLRERATRAMDENRRPLEHRTYILRSDSKPIEVLKGEEIFKVGEWNVVWM